MDEKKYKKKWAELLWLSELFSRYYQGKATPKEKKSVESWDPEKDSVVELQFLKPDAETEKIWKSVSSELGLKKNSMPLKIKFYRYAAAASMVLFISLGGYLFFNSDKPELEIVQTQTIADDIRLINLPDGTKVWVNYNTKIQYPKEFSVDKREITLTGEAFFEVTRDPSKPFIIHSGDITTTVLGTSFDVRAYPGNALEVVVHTGKVKVASATQEVILVKGDAVTFIKEKEVLVKSKKEITEPGWKKTLLDVEGISLEQLIVKLQDEYHFSVAYENQEIKNLTMKGVLDTRQGMPDMLHTIAFALNLKVQQSGKDNYVLSK